MTKVSVLSLGDRWEDGTEIYCKVNGPRYWKTKLHRQIMRAISLRDQKGLSDLIKESALLRDVRNESFFTSLSIMILISHISTCYPEDDIIKGISLELLTKMPRITKTMPYRTIISNNYRTPIKKSDYDKQTLEIQGKSTEQDFKIENTTQFNRLSENPVADTNSQLALLKADPCYNLDIQTAALELKSGDWTILIDRIDQIPHDFSSWRALQLFIQKSNPQIIEDIKCFVESYWPQYHGGTFDDLENLVEGDEQNPKEIVFHLLGFIE